MKYWILILLLVTPLTAFWAQDQQVSSLDKYDQRIEELHIQKNNLDSSWEEFRSTYGWITNFIAKDLSDDRRNELAAIVETYLTLSRENHKNITIRKDFFTSLERFIDTEKVWSFEKYREKSISIENERLELSELIKDTELQKQARTDILRTHIADNALERRHNIRLRVEPILRERLEWYIANEAFRKLSDDRKALVFWRILWKIQMQQSDLESSGIQTTVVLDRIETYKIIESIMLEYISFWR